MRTFLQDSGLPREDIDRLAWIVSHHHTYGLETGMDYQLLLEADYFVNAAQAAPDRARREQFILSGSGRRMAALLWGEN